jgi:hypothetical protein
MYVELRTGFEDDAEGPAWIGRVRFSKTGRTIFYRGRELQRKASDDSSGMHTDIATHEVFWVSGVKARRGARPWVDRTDVAIDDDARDEFERLIRR